MSIETYFGLSFCETATAGPFMPWHIRRLSIMGKKYGGGADTKALCGRKVSWDLEVQINPTHLQHCCRKCAVAFAQEGITK